MIAAYLYVNAAMYVFFAVWQTLSPWTTATALGFEQIASSGRSEYLVVYGGFQLGLTAFFIWAAKSAANHRTGLIFALCLYVPIVPYRLITVATFWPVNAVLLTVGTFEVSLLIAGLVLFLKKTDR